MSCEEIQSLLVCCADGELSSAESEIVVQHLRECEACRLLLEELRSDAAQMRAEPEPDVPDQSVYNIMTRVLQTSDLNSPAQRHEADRPSAGPRNLHSRSAPVHKTALRAAATVLVHLAGTAIGALLGHALIPEVPNPASMLARVQSAVVEFQSLAPTHRDVSGQGQPSTHLPSNGRGQGKAYPPSPANGAGQGESSSPSPLNGRGQGEGDRDTGGI